MTTQEKNKMATLKKHINNADLTNLSTARIIAPKIEEIKPLVITFGTLKTITWFNQKVQTINQTFKTS